VKRRVCTNHVARGCGKGFPLSRARLGLGFFWVGGLECGLEGIPGSMLGDDEISPCCYFIVRYMHPGADPVDLVEMLRYGFGYVRAVDLSFLCIMYNV
jgi:hypothetical protein